jgi:hypothetical protein
MVQGFLVGGSRWVILSVAAIALGFYCCNFWGVPLSNDPAVWGQFGDYMGGILNPIIAFGALLWVVNSVTVQKQELSETKKALQDSHLAQQAQAETTLLAAQIETLNIELSSTVHYLTHLRDRQLRLSDLQNRPDHPTMWVNENNQTVGLASSASTVEAFIRVNMREEELIMSDIKELSKRFRSHIPDRQDPE